MAKEKNHPETVIVNNDPLLIVRAIVDTNSFDVEKNTVDVVWATETPCLTRDADGELFYEILSMDPEHVRMDRFKSGAPVLDNHDRFGSITKIQLGKVQDPKLGNKQGTCTVRFSKRAAIADFVNDVKDGIAENVSTGYRVFMYRDMTGPNDQRRTLMAIDWEPTELSWVPVPQDYKSSVRAIEVVAPEIEQAEVIEEDTVDNTLNNDENLIIDKTRKMEETPEQKVAREASEKMLRDNATTAERTRSIEITEAVRSAGLDVSFAETHIVAGTASDEVRKLVIAEFASKQADPINPNGGRKPGDAGYVIPGEDREHLGKTRAIEEALSIRAFGVASLGAEGPTTETGKMVANGEHLTLLDHARGYVELSGFSSKGLTKNEILTRAMTSTDYPIALANVLNKNLKKRYTAAVPQWQKFAVKVDANDFKPLAGVRVDGSFLPDEITEEGEYKYASLKETGDSFALKTFGKKLKLTRKLLINDDLGAFTKFAPMFANGMLRNQSNIITGLFTANNGTGRILSDTNALFSAAHNNYDSVGAAMSITSFAAARLAMRRQVGLDKQPIEITPMYLWCPPELETLAYQLINSTITPNTTSQANPFKGLFEVLVDPYLTDPKAWYIIADPAEIEIVKWASLNGQEGIYTEQKYDFETDALVIKVRNDFNATIEEFVGVYKNKGV